jgi:hypothetical protein
MVEWEEEVEEAGISIKNLFDGKEDTVPKKKIYAKHPHLTTDNHSSGENVMDYIGTATCRRDCFPKAVISLPQYTNTQIHKRWFFFCAKVFFLFNRLLCICVAKKVICLDRYTDTHTK